MTAEGLTKITFVNKKLAKDIKFQRANLKNQGLGHG